MALPPNRCPAAVAVALLTVAPAPASHRPNGIQGSLAFADLTADAGIDFVHQRGASPDKHLPETMGAGVGWLDYDGDGRFDLYFIQGGRLTEPMGAAGNALYRNLGGRFERASAGLDDRGFGMGVSAADYDGDGWIDVFVSNFGLDALYRNNGDGTFAPAHAGVEDGGWSASAAWGDLDSDALPELYVTRYVDYDLTTALRCGAGAGGHRAYCHVDFFDGVKDALYRNDGAGTFTDIAAAAGVANAAEGKGLGVAMGDLDGDGRTDIYVANDTQQNFLYLNRGDGTFEEQGLFSGTGYGGDGRSQAGMGVELADVDGDGTSEILVTNFAFEPNNLYRKVAPAAYVDDGSTLGFAAPGIATLAFGIVALDADGDGDRDIVVANGHILDDIDDTQDNSSYAQRNHLFENALAGLRQRGAAPSTQTLFAEIGQTAGAAMGLVDVSRGLAVGDYDGDGRPDIAVTTSGGPARLLVNDSGHANGRLVVRLRGRAATREALGARVRVSPISSDPGRTIPEQWAEVRSSSSYLSQSAGDLYFGLGDAVAARLEVTWPGGSSTVLERVPVGHLALLVQGVATPVLRPLSP